MLELIPFAENECLVCVFLGPKGRWFLLNQISRLVFGWDTRVFKRKILYNAMTTKNKYRIIKVSDSYLLEQLKAINMADRESKHVHLIHIASLDAFIKSYSRRLSLFTKLYDTVHRLQWGNSSNNYEEYGTYTKSSKTAKRKRTLTMADKKYVASLQNWLCAWCAESLPARFEVDHIMQFAEGGSDDIENLQALCPNCHAIKTEMDRRVQRQQDDYESTALLYDHDEADGANKSFKTPAHVKRSMPLLGGKKPKPKQLPAAFLAASQQQQDSDDEEIGFADILVNEDEEDDDEDDTLTRVNKKAKINAAKNDTSDSINNNNNNTSPNNNTMNKNDTSANNSPQQQKPMRQPITSSFFGQHVAAARKISAAPNRLQPSQSQELYAHEDRDESSDEDLVLPRHMQEDSDSDDAAADPIVETSFVAQSKSGANKSGTGGANRSGDNKSGSNKTGDNKTGPGGSMNNKNNGQNGNKNDSAINSKNNNNKKDNNSTKGNNNAKNDESGKAGAKNSAKNDDESIFSKYGANKLKINPYEAGLDEDTEILPVPDDDSSDNNDNNKSGDNNNNDTMNNDHNLSSDNNYNEEDEEMTGNNNQNQIRSDNDNENNEENDNSNDSDNNDEVHNNDEYDSSDEDLFGTQKSVKIVSAKTGQWTSVSPHFASKELAQPLTRHLQTLKVNQSLALNALKHRVMNSNQPDKNSTLGHNPIRTQPEKSVSSASKKKSAAKSSAKSTEKSGKPKKVPKAAIMYEKMLKERKKK